MKNLKRNSYYNSIDKFYKVNEKKNINVVCKKDLISKRHYFLKCLNCFLIIIALSFILILKTSFSIDKIVRDNYFTFIVMFSVFLAFKTK